MHTILHIGAGQATELSDWLKTGAERIVLVEPNPELAENLRQKTSGEPRVTVVEAAIACNSANNHLYVYNLPEASSLHLPTGLKALFPGLKTIATHRVTTLSPEQLLADQSPEAGQPAMLVLQCPGEEHAIVQALINSDQLKQFSQIHMASNPEPYYQGSPAVEETIQLLADYGYDVVRSSQQDPDWPSWQISRNPLKDKIAELEETARSLQGQLEARNRDLKELCQERDAFNQKLDFAEATLSEKSKTEQRAKTELAQLKQELAETNKALEDHKNWFRSQKVQAEELQAENAKLKSEIEQLKAALEATELDKQNPQQSPAAGQNELSHLEQKIEQLFLNQSNQLQQATNALGQHVTRSFIDQRRHIQSVTSLEHYFETGTQPLEYGQWAIGADLAVHLIRAIEHKNYDLIIEFGSGTSTVLMARVIANKSSQKITNSDHRSIAYDTQSEASGTLGKYDSYDLPQRILSFEQNKTHYQKTKADLAREGLADLVDLVLAPLVPIISNGQHNDRALFYDYSSKLSRIAQLYEGRQARVLVLVDGPYNPEGNVEAREPALNCILQYLSAHQLDIVLDDAQRKGEKQVLQSWQKTCENRGITCEQRFIDTERGAAWLSISP